MNRRKSITEVLIERDGLNEREAKERVKELHDKMMARLDEGNIADAFNICEEEGLEPDYLEDLI